MSRINGDKTGDLRVVARVLKDVIGVCNLTPYIKSGCIMVMIVKPSKSGWQVLSMCPNSWVYFLWESCFCPKSIVSVGSFRFLFVGLEVAEGDGLIDTVHR